MIVASVLLTLTFALAANGIETFHGCVAIAANASDVFVPLSVPRTESSFVVAFVVTPVFTNALPSNTFVAYQWVDTMPMTGAMSTAGPCVTTPPLGKLSSPLQSGIPRSFLWIQRPQLVRQFSNAIDVYFTLVTWPEEVEQVVRGTATVVTGPQTPLGMSVTANTIALFSYSRDGENFDDDDWVAVSLRGSRGPLVLTRNSERTPALVAYQLLQFRNAVVTETNFTLVAGVSMPQNRAIVAKRTFLTVSSVMTGSEDLFRCGALRIVDDITTNAFISVARNVASTMCQANAIVSDVPLMGGSESMRISILLSQNSATNCASTFASERAFVTLLGVTPVILSLPFNATQVFPYIDANGCVSVWRSVGDVAVNVVVQVVFIKNSPTASISSTSLTSLTSTSTMLVTSNTGTLVAGGSSMSTQSSAFSTDQGSASSTGVGDSFSLEGSVQSLTFTSAISEQASAFDSSSQPTDIGEIVGISLAACVIVIALIAIGVFLLSRRRRRVVDQSSATEIPAARQYSQFPHQQQQQQQQHRNHYDSPQSPL